MTLLRIDASIQGERSASAEIAGIVEQEWQAAHPGDAVVRRHLGTEPLPADLWAPAVHAAYVPAENHSPEMKKGVELAQSLVAELAAADAVLLAFPLYNFGTSQHVKAWIDITMAGAEVGAPLLKDKPTVLVTARGGSYAAGTPREGWDHATPFLRRILEDVWGAKLTIIEREFTLVGVNPALDAFTDQGRVEHDKAKQAALDAGKALGV